VQVCGHTLLFLSNNKAGWVGHTCGFKTDSNSSGGLLCSSTASGLCWQQLPAACVIGSQYV
jgi:hypothetical protein